MSSTFTAPIRIGTRSTTSNEGVTSPDTYGAAVCSRQVDFVSGATAEVIVPAGSIINNIQVYVNDAATSRTLDITTNGTTTAIGTISTAALGVNSASFATTAAAANLLANVGIYDATVTLGTEVSSAGTLSVVYTARNANGTITPYGQGYTNS